MLYTPEPWKVTSDSEIFGRFTIDGVDYAEMTRIEEGYEMDDNRDAGDGEEGDRRDREAREREEGNRRIIQAAPKLYRIGKALEPILWNDNIPPLVKVYEKELKELAQIISDIERGEG